MHKCCDILIKKEGYKMAVKIIGDAIPNLPWQDRPAELCDEPVWRYDNNPIINRNPTKKLARVFNSAAVPFGDGFAAVFRGEQKDGIPHLYKGFSKDGINWEIEDERVELHLENGEICTPKYEYDPRIVKIEDTYYIIWCEDFHGAAIGMAKTKDFENFTKLENPFIPYNRNAVLFPKKINGLYALLSRPSDSAHTPFGDIFLSYSPDLEYWGHHRHVMSPSGHWWENVKIGSGAAPIETSEGWLMFYHGVTGTCNGFVYSIGGVILDINDPSKVLYRCNRFLLTPEKDYEEKGFVPNVCFPCAALSDSETGRIALYYGAADSYVALAFTTVEEAVNYIKTYSD